MDNLAPQPERRPREYFNLILGVIMAVAVWYGMSLRDTVPGSPFDLTIATAISATCVLAVVIQLIMTRVWTFRAVGLLFVVSGVAVYFGMLAYISRTEDGRLYEFSLDVVRALFIIGVPALTVGLVAGFLGWILRRQPDEGF